MTDGEIQKINDYLFLPDSNDLSADLAFVFGTWLAWEASVHKAAELYKNNSVPKILVSGGVNRNTNINEGDLMTEEIIKLGVPKEVIITENKSNNTLENVVFSKEILDKTIGLQNIKTITLNTKNFHARRCLMTMKKHMPSHIEYKICNYVSNYGFTKDNWQFSEKGRERVLGEIDRIEKYLAKGDIAEL